MMQLNKFLAHCGVASRRKCAEFIKAGRVSVNGKQELVAATRVDSEKDTVSFDSRQVQLPGKYQYVLLNKPPDVLTSVEDDRDRKTVVELVESEVRLFPVGRLDLDTTGVLLLTNDGELAYRLMHPKFEIEKVYEAKVAGFISQEAIRMLEQGVEIDPDVVVKGETELVKRDKHKSIVRISVHEGKKRQIKRMLKAVGFPVERLSRIRFAGLTVDGLKPGGWRHLKKDEERDLYRITGLHIG